MLWVICYHDFHDILELNEQTIELANIVNLRISEIGPCEQLTIVIHTIDKSVEYNDNLLTKCIYLLRLIERNKLNYWNLQLIFT